MLVVDYIQSSDVSATILHWEWIIKSKSTETHRGRMKNQLRLEKTTLKKVGQSCKKKTNR
jgi:hypothetical protein